ncbi:MAG: hypothetical protein NTZ67_08555, partial [Gammaproteobacteria bacterium]|nr:hypothetical protein [Gammaproteobacteria bacterium]
TIDAICNRLMTLYCTTHKIIVDASFSHDTFRLIDEKIICMHIGYALNFSITADWQYWRKIKQDIDRQLLSNTATSKLKLLTYVLLYLARVYPDMRDLEKIQGFMNELNQNAELASQLVNAYHIPDENFFSNSLLNNFYNADLDGFKAIISAQYIFLADLPRLLDQATLRMLCTVIEKVSSEDIAAMVTLAENQQVIFTENENLLRAPRINALRYILDKQDDGDDDFLCFERCRSFFSFSVVTDEELVEFIDNYKEIEEITKKETLWFLVLKNWKKNIINFRETVKEISELNALQCQFLQNHKSEGLDGNMLRPHLHSRTRREILQANGYRWEIPEFSDNHVTFLLSVRSLYYPWGLCCQILNECYLAVSNMTISKAQIPEDELRLFLALNAPNSIDFEAWAKGIKNQAVLAVIADRPDLKLTTIIAIKNSVASQTIKIKMSEKQKLVELSLQMRNEIHLHSSFLLYQQNSIFMPYASKERILIEKITNASDNVDLLKILSIELNDSCKELELEKITEAENRNPYVTLILTLIKMIQTPSWLALKTHLLDEMDKIYFEIEPSPLRKIMDYIDKLIVMKSGSNENNENIIELELLKEQILILLTSDFEEPTPEMILTQLNAFKINDFTAPILMEINGIIFAEEEKSEEYKSKFNNCTLLKWNLHNAINSADSIETMIKFHSDTSHFYESCFSAFFKTLITVCTIIKLGLTKTEEHYFSPLFRSTR